MSLKCYFIFHQCLSTYCLFYIFSCHMCWIISQSNQSNKDTCFKIRKPLRYQDTVISKHMHNLKDCVLMLWWLETKTFPIQFTFLTLTHLSLLCKLLLIKHYIFLLCFKQASCNRQPQNLSSKTELKNLCLLLWVP